MFIYIYVYFDRNVSSGGGRGVKTTYAISVQLNEQYCCVLFT